MTQFLKIFGIGAGGGIVSVLVLAGILLYLTNTNPQAGLTAIWSGISIGTILGVLGIIAVLKRIL